MLETCSQFGEAWLVKSNQLRNKNAPTLSSSPSSLFVPRNCFVSRPNLRRHLWVAERAAKVRTIANLGVCLGLGNSDVSLSLFQYPYSLY